MVIQQNPNMSTLQLLKLKTNSGMRELALHEPFNYLHVRLKLREERKSSLTHGYHFQSGYLIFWGHCYEQSKKTETNWEFWFWPTQCVWKNMKQIWWSTCLPIWGTCRVCVCANSVYQSQLYPWSIPNVVSQRRHLWVQGVKVSERIPRTKF